MGNLVGQAPPVEFAKRYIQTLAKANRFLQTEYWKLFNQKFSVTLKTESIFVPTAKGIDLDILLCEKQMQLEPSPSKTVVFRFWMKDSQLSMPVAKSWC